MRKLAMTALAGTSIEWYDFFLYGTAAALVFPTAFFAADMPPMVALIASFGTFAVGFIARPVGGVLFGHMGDRVGRKKALVTALLMMGVATTLIGCLPTYALVGPLAPVLLVLLRFVQGLAIGGQWGGAMLIVTENAPPGKRGFYGSFAQAGAPLGLIIANLAFLGVSFSVTADEFMDWGWRIPFLLSAALIVLCIYIQLNLEDTAAFKALSGTSTSAAPDKPANVKGPERSPVLEALRNHPREIALGAGAFIAVQVMFYILIAFVLAWGTHAEGLALPRNTVLAGVLIGAFFQIPSVFLASVWSDRYGRRGVYMLGAVLVGAWAFVLFPLMSTGEFLWIVVAMSVGQLFLGMMYGPQAALLAELFPTAVRYSGASLGYQIGAILGGALSPGIATALWTGWGTEYVSAYIAFASLITLFCVWRLSETRGRSMSA